MIRLWYRRAIPQAAGQEDWVGESAGPSHLPLLPGSWWESFLYRTRVFVWLCLLVDGAVLAVSLLLFRSWSPDPGSPDLNLASSYIGIWQVLATFVAVGFAGLAIMFQLVPAEQLVALDRRLVIVHWTLFRPALIVGSAATIILGVVAVWLPTPETLIVGFVALLLPAVAAVTASYWRCARAFGRPAELERLAEEWLLLRVQRRIDDRANNALAVARINDAGLSAWQSRSDGEWAFTEIVMRSDRRQRVTRLNLARIRSIGVAAAAMNAEAINTAAQSSTDLLGARTKLRLHVRPGATVDAGGVMISIASDAPLDRAHLDRIERELRDTITVDPDFADLVEFEIRHLRD
jgi:hypothetical protein